MMLANGTVSYEALDVRVDARPVNRVSASLLGIFHAEVSCAQLLQDLASLIFRYDDPLSFDDNGFVQDGQFVPDVPILPHFLRAETELVRPTGLDVVAQYLHRLVQVRGCPDVLHPRVGTRSVDDFAELYVLGEFLESERLVHSNSVFQDVSW